MLYYNTNSKADAFIEKFEEYYLIRELNDDHSVKSRYGCPVIPNIYVPIKFKYLWVDSNQTKNN